MRRVLVPFDLSPQPPAVNDSVHRLQGLTMGTSWSVAMVCSEQRDLLTVQRAIERQLDLVIDQMSTWLPDSFLSRFNQAPADSWHEMPSEFSQVLRHALSMAAATDGAYDPSAGPLVNAWGFGPEQPRQSRPDAETLAAARQRTGWQRIQIDDQRVRQPGDLYLDFSAIAKGFAVDLVSRHLYAIGIRDHLVEIGGELKGMGIKPDAQPWWVELERPPRIGPSIAADAGAAIDGESESSALIQHVIALHGLSVATSGDYRRYFDCQGQRYCHTLDPRTGEPITNHTAAITVIHPECMTADALSTALNVMGATEGIGFANQHQIAALFVVRHGDGFSEHMSQAFEALLQ